MGFKLDSNNNSKKPVVMWNNLNFLAFETALLENEISKSVLINGVLFENNLYAPPFE
ncbi:16305_t:CDS:2 [Dentiscutata erythropus]|uniref:16305_t:CDS:1 n=1 Tax=Dentiscutata erythropus TaxID=1348616 RepID=A0A9N9E3Q3_9GLOM|nr:16305_t:CDS:2 [Dentiscutata erythropus]